MYHLCRFKQILSLVFLTILSVVTNASQDSNQADIIIGQLYSTLHNKPALDMPTRIVTISAQLLGKPYQLGALGEGIEGDFDQAPLYRTDAFDCETYVDTVLAIALANNPTTFKQCIRQIRYRNGKVSFINRNHFTCIDWNQNNQHQGFLRDITTTFHDKNNQPIAQFAQALINKPGWYQHFSVEHIRISPSSPIEQAKRLALLKQKSKSLPIVTSIVPYLPLTALFDSSGKANQSLFKQIPNAAIIEIIRPNWDLDKQIGTHLNVSHLGFAVWEKGLLIFRETSSNDGHVIDYPLIDYLREAHKSPTIKGINIQVVIPQEPLSEDCKLFDVETRKV